MFSLINKHARLSTFSSLFNLRLQHRYKSIDKIVPERTTIVQLEIKSNRKVPYIDKFSNKGFTIRGSFYYGSVALLPKDLFYWRIQSHTELTTDCFSLFHLVYPKIDILILGMGDKIVPIPNEIRSFFKSHNISLEIQNTRTACSTFNFLLDEGRIVAAGLIPPKHVEII